jgi:hypothetical protein
MWFLVVFFVIFIGVFACKRLYPPFSTPPLTSTLQLSLSQASSYGGAHPLYYNRSSLANDVTSSAMTDFSTLGQSITTCFRMMLGYIDVYAPM